MKDEKKKTPGSIPESGILKKDAGGVEKVGGDVNKSTLRKQKPKKIREKRDGSAFLSIARDGILFKNPVLVQLLGTCPTLAISTTLKNGIGMGLATTAVLVGSNIIISLLRRLIPQKIRIAAYIVIISGFVTVIEMLMNAYMYELSGSLGVYIPLIVVNCIILARAESFASVNKVLPSALDGLFMGLGFTVALALLSSAREISGNGTIFDINVSSGIFPPALMMILPPGGFLALGFLTAAVQKLLAKKEGD